MKALQVAKMLRATTELKQCMAVEEILSAHDLLYDRKFSWTKCFNAIKLGNYKSNICSDDTYRITFG